MGTAELAGDPAAHASQSFGGRRVGGEELLGEANGTEGQADGFLNALSLRQRDFATTAAEVNQEQTRRQTRNRFAGLGGDGLGHDTEVDEAAFFKAGDGFHGPAGFSFDPGLKGGSIAGVAHRGGGDDPDFVDAVSLDGALEALEGLDGVGHGFRRYEAGLKDAGAQTRDFAVFMDGAELVGDDPGDLETAGVGTDVDGSEGGHGRCRFSGRRDDGSAATIHDEGLRFDEGLEECFGFPPFRQKKGEKMGHGGLVHGEGFDGDGEFWASQLETGRDAGCYP